MIDALVIFAIVVMAELWLSQQWFCIGIAVSSAGVVVIVGTWRRGGGDNYRTFVVSIKDKALIIKYIPGTAANSAHVLSDASRMRGSRIKEIRIAVLVRFWFSIFLRLLRLLLLLSFFVVVKTPKGGLTAGVCTGRGWHGK
jgi:hypothetical protein